MLRVFDDSSWKPATLFAAPPVNVEIQGYVGSPIQNNVTLTAQSMVEPIPGVYVYDMGQNMVGVPRLTFKGKAGQEITIRFRGDELSGNDPYRAGRPVHDRDV